MDSIMGCGKVAIWSMITIAVTCLLFGTCILQGCTEFLRSAPNVDDDQLQNLEKYWGTLALAIKSLYMSTTGGADWSVIADALDGVGDGIYWWLFVLYILFYNCVIVNALTS